MIIGGGNPCSCAWHDFSKCTDRSAGIKPTTTDCGQPVVSKAKFDTESETKCCRHGKMVVDFDASCIIASTLLEYHVFIYTCLSTLPGMQQSCNMNSSNVLSQSLLHQSHVMCTLVNSGTTNILTQGCTRIASPEEVPQIANLPFRDVQPLVSPHTLLLNVILTIQMSIDHTLLLNVILTIQMSINVQFEEFESAAAHNKADFKIQETMCNQSYRHHKTLRLSFQAILRHNLAAIVNMQVAVFNKVPWFTINVVFSAECPKSTSLHFFKCIHQLSYQWPI